jgi:hypothetical protein
MAFLIELPRLSATKHSPLEILKKVRKMRRIFLLVNITILVFLISCQFLEDGQKFTEKEGDLVWVYIDFEMPDKDSLVYSHRFGQIGREKYEMIQANEYLSGYITLRNMRYITLQDSLDIWEDENDTGTITFRSEYIQLIELIKGDPILTYPKEELTEKALTYRTKIERSKISN